MAAWKNTLRDPPEGMEQDAQGVVATPGTGFISSRNRLPEADFRQKCLQSSKLPIILTINFLHNIIQNGRRSPLRLENGVLNRRSVCDQK
jgi:hypothetical protein